MTNLFKVYMNDSDKFRDELIGVLDSGYIGQGKKVEKLESILKNWFKNENLLLLNSGTSALHLALDVIRETYNLIPSETDVLCTPLSCLATSLPIKSMGFNIKWIDINKDNLNIDLDDLERKLTPYTRIVMLVHWGGTPVDLYRLEQIKNNYLNRYDKPLLIIEDSAHCFDSRVENNNIGMNKFQNYLCYSLQAIKFLTTVDGGILITPNAKSYKQAKLKRWFGLDRDSGSTMRCIQKLDYVGFKFQPNDVLSTIGIGNFEGAVNNVKINKCNALFYNKELKGIEDVTLLNVPYLFESSYWIYTILVNRKEDFKRMMKSKKIEVSEVHQRMDTQPIFQKFKSILPNMDYLEKRYISIPVGWWLSKDELNYIVDSIKGGW